MKRSFWGVRGVWGLISACLFFCAGLHAAVPVFEPISEVVLGARQRVAVASVDATANTLVFAQPHGFTSGQQADFLVVGGQAPEGLVSGTGYFLIRVDELTLKLALNAGDAGSGTAIDLGSVGSGTFFLQAAAISLGGTATTLRGGKLILNGDGTYTYTPPPLAGTPGNVSETFVLTLSTGSADGGGNRTKDLVLNGAKGGAAQKSSAVPTQKVFAGRSVVLPLRASDEDGDALSYRVSSSNPRIQARVKTGNPYLKLRVKHAGDNGGAGIDGILLFQLFRDLAPNTVGYISGLAQSGYYDGQKFHRVIKDFVIQGGDPGGTGTGGPGFQFEDELHAALTFVGKGQLAMANSGKNSSTGFLATNGSQFFVTTGSEPPRHLNFKHTIFGQLVRGFDVLAKAESVAVGAGDVPTVNLIIESAEVVENHQDAVLTVGATGLGVATVTIVVSDGVNPEVKRTVVIESISTSENLRTFLVSPENAVVAKETIFNYNLSAVDLEADYPVFEYGLMTTPSGGPATGSIRSGQSADVGGHGGGLVQVLGETGVTGKTQVVFGTYGLDMANRNLTQPPRNLSNCATTLGSKEVSCASTAALAPGLRLYEVRPGGERVPFGAVVGGAFVWASVESVIDATRFTTTVNAPKSETGLTWVALAFSGSSVAETGESFALPVLLNGVFTSFNSEFVTCQNTTGLVAGMKLYNVEADGKLSPLGVSVAQTLSTTQFLLPFAVQVALDNKTWVAAVTPSGVPESTDFSLADLGVGGAAILLKPERVQATRGVALVDQIVTGFVMADPKGVPGDFTARINWGDSSGIGAGRRANINASSDSDISTRPVFAADPRTPRLGSMVVKGTHTYSKAGSYPLAVDVMDAKGLNRRAVGVVRVSEPGALVVQANVVQVAGSQVQNRVLATFRDPAGGGSPSEYRATLDWGDGGYSLGAITGNGAGQFVVRGSHKYQDPKFYPISIRVQKVGQTGSDAVDWGVLNATGFTGTPHLPPFAQTRLVAYWASPVRGVQVFSSSDKPKYLFGDLVILNQGRISSKNFKISFYVSTDKELSSDDKQLSIKVGTTDLKEIPLNALKAGQGIRLSLTKSESTDFRLRIPGNENPGGKNLLLKLDYNDPIVDAGPASRKIMVAGPLPAF